ncbi:MAG: hypothetical protein AAGI38_02095, partial [Bacteroidota bacterium]
LLQNIIDVLGGDETLRQILGAFSTLVSAIVLLFIGWLIAKVIANIVEKLLRRLKLDELGERLNQSEVLQNSKVKIRPVFILKKFIYWLVLLMFVLMASDYLGLTIVSEQIGKLVAYLPVLLTAGAVFVIGYYIANGVKDLVGSSCKSLGINSWKLISNAVFYILLLTVVVTALNQAGVDTQIITANISIIIAGVILAFSIAYGLAARPVLANMLTSFYTKNKYHTGQVIDVDGYKGEIIHMDAISLTLDLGDRQVVFPLHRLMDGMVTIHPAATSSNEAG